MACPATAYFHTALIPLDIKSSVNLLLVFLLLLQLPLSSYCYYLPSPHTKGPLLLPPQHFSAVTDLRQNENKGILSNRIFSLIPKAAFVFYYTYLFNPAWHSPKEMASIPIYTVQQILLLYLALLPPKYQYSNNLVNSEMFSGNFLFVCLILSFRTTTSLDCF